MKRVLLTGASGFIGRHCLPLLLSSGYEVHAVFSKTLQENLTDVHWHQSNLLDSGQVYELMARVQPTHLLHLAWYAIPGKYANALENFRWVQASLDLLQAFVQHQGQRVVMAGTCFEYDWKYGYCSEEITPLLPRNVYGICKHSLQLMVDGFSWQTKLSAAWGRIFFLYGSHEHPDRLVSSIIRSLLQCETARCSHGKQIRDFLYVEDVAGALVALLESNVTGSVNIASGYPIELKTLIYKIAEKLNKSALIQIGAISTSVNEPFLLTADVRRLTDEVKWQPKYNLDTGLEKSISWWQKHILE